MILFEKLAGDRGSAGSITREQVEEELHFEGEEKLIPFSSTASFSLTAPLSSAL